MSDQGKTAKKKSADGAMSDFGSASGPVIRDEVKERASKYLAYKPRTRKELCDHLRGRGFPSAEVNACADLMEEYGLLDDLEYSRLYIEMGFENGRGLERIRRELQTKGVDRFTIEDALAEIEDIPDEYDTALEQAILALDGMDVSDLEYSEKQKIKARIAGRLARRGFRTDTVYRAINAAFERGRED